MSPVQTRAKPFFFLVSQLLLRLLGQANFPPLESVRSSFGLSMFGKSYLPRTRACSLGRTNYRHRLFLFSFLFSFLSFIFCFLFHFSSLFLFSCCGKMSIVVLNFCSWLEKLNSGIWKTVHKFWKNNHKVQKKITALDISTFVIWKMLTGSNFSPSLKRCSRVRKCVCFTGLKNCAHEKNIQGIDIVICFHFATRTKIILLKLFYKYK